MFANKKVENKTKTAILRETIKTTVSIWRSCYFFMVASFLNTIFPIITCIILSYTPILGLQCILGVGRTSYFTIAFSQLGITFSLSVLFLYSKYFMPNKKLDSKKQEEYALSNAILFGFFIAIFLVIVYIIASYMYMYYSTNLPNTYIAFEQGMNYVYTSSIYIFFICLMDVLLIYVYNKKKNSAIYFLIYFYLFSYILIYLLANIAKLYGVGVGISLTISIIITIIILSIYIFIYFPININLKIPKFFKNVRRIKGLIQEAVTGICINLFRGIGLLIISFTVFNHTSNDVIPMAYNLAIIFLLNYMYIIAFGGIGLADMIKYFYVYYLINDKTNSTKFFWLMAFINLLFAILLTYICSVAALPLASLYSQNNSYIEPLKVPKIPNGMPKIIIHNLPPTKFPLVPTDFYEPNKSLLQMVKNYLNNLINNPIQNPVFFDWFDWFKHNPKNLNLWIIQHPINFFDWLQKYEYYASCNPSVVNAFINLRTKLEISQPNQFELMIPELKFNSKSMIYLGAFGISYSTYYIFSAAKTAISKEKMPIWLIIIGSFCLITFVLAFGSCFTLILQNKKTNPFQNLDAFTFPLMIVGYILFLISIIELEIANLKNKKWLKKMIKKHQIKKIKIVDSRLI